MFFGTSHGKVKAPAASRYRDLGKVLLGSLEETVRIVKWSCVRS